MKNKEKILASMKEMVNEAEEVMIFITEKEISVSTPEKTTRKQDVCAILSAMMATLLNMVETGTIPKKALEISVKQLMEEAEKIKVKEEDAYGDLLKEIILNNVDDEETTEKIKKIFNLIDEL